MSDLREEATDVFCALTGLPDIERVIQRGRDPVTARFTFELADGTKINIGTIETLWSQAKLGKVMAVAAGRVVRPVKPADWRNTIGGLILHATDVEETPHEALADRALDWLEQYLSGDATGDRDGAIPFRRPFARDGEIWVHAEHFARWLRREYSEQIPVADIRIALTDLGFKAARIDYDKDGDSGERKRTTARYYRAPRAILEGDRDD